MAYTPLLVLTGVGVPPYSARGLRQTLEPVQAAAQQRRTVTGVLVDVSDPIFRVYRSTISCTDYTAPAFSGLWPGAVCTVDCVAELAYLTGSGSPERAVVSSRTEGSWTFYRPRLVMQVTGFQQETDEWGGVTGWQLALEEIDTEGSSG